MVDASPGAAVDPAISALSVSAVSKRFGPALALDRVDLTIARGEIHALLGENGSGKSTLVKILSGYHTPEPGGAIWAWGQQLRLPVRDGPQAGIAVIHQDLGLVDEMTVVENLGISVGYGRSLLGSVSWRKERRAARRFLAALGLAIDPDTPVAELSPAERTLVAVARATRELELRGMSNVLFLLDEPTVSLPPEEVRKVLDLMRMLAERGDAVLFISHRLHEVLEVADRITVLRDGRAVSVVHASGADEALLARLMLGRELDAFYPERRAPSAESAVLRVDDLTGGIVTNLSLSVGASEIVGFTGLQGHGYDELAALIAGARPRRAGSVWVGDDGPLGPGPGDAFRAGIALVPANRRRDGIWPDASVWENLSLPQLTRNSRWSTRLRPAKERSVAERLMKQFFVKPADPRLPLSAFSGGNQQKIVLAKWLQQQPRVLLLDEPTQGVDAGARREILEIISRTASDGAAVLICSADLEQLAGVCHRVVVLRNGATAAVHTGDALNEESLMASLASQPD